MCHADEVGKTWELDIPRHSEDRGHLENCLWKYNVARANEIKERAEGQARGKVYYNLGGTGFVM